jgi:hypothetical protein
LIESHHFSERYGVQIEFPLETEEIKEQTDPSLLPRGEFSMRLLADEVTN